MKKNLFWNFAVQILLAIALSNALPGPIYPSHPRLYQYYAEVPEESRQPIYYSTDMSQENSQDHSYISPSPMARAAYGPIDIIAIHALELITPDPVKKVFNNSFTVMRNHLKDPVPKKKKRPISYLSPYEKKISKNRYKPQDDLDLDDEDDESDEEDDDDEYEEEEAYDDYPSQANYEESDPIVEYRNDFEDYSSEEVGSSRENRFLRYFYRTPWDRWPGHYNNFDRHYYSQYRPMRIHPIHNAPGWKPGY